jgi:hypothetical protein
MKIYIDENTSHYLAEGLNLLQIPENTRLSDPIEVRTVVNDFGKGAQDEDWIPKVGEVGGCIITQDFNIHRIRHQNELCKNFDLGMFYFKPPSKKGYTYWNMVSLVIKVWKEVCDLATKEKRPFAYKITPKGKFERI